MRHNIVRQQRIRRSFTPARSVALVLGLIQVMQHLDNITEVGRGIAVAFVANEVKTVGM